MMEAVSDFWLREAGLEILAHPGAIEATAFHALSEPFYIAPHHHVQSLQIDVVAGCKGKVFVDDQWLSFDSDVGHIAYPGQVHGYELSPVQPDAAVFNFKILVSSDITLVHERTLPSVASLGDKSDQIVEIATKARQYWGDPSSPRAAAAIQLLQLLAVWPVSRHTASVSGVLEVDDHVERAASLIESQLDRRHSLDELAEEAGVSGRHLTRLFVSATGMTPARYATVRRLDRAKVLLIDQKKQVADIADELGFASPATFTRWFRLNEGRTPTEFRESPTVF